MVEASSRISAVSLVEEDTPPIETSQPRPNADVMSDLTDYLAKLGLGDAHLANVISLMQATRADVATEAVGRQAEAGETARPPDVDVARPAPVEAPAAPKTVKLLLAEEQQILMQAYRTFFTEHPDTDLLGCSSNTTADVLIDAVTFHQPDVILIGVKALRPSTVEMLIALKDAHPMLGVVLLFAFYDAQGIKALREFSRDVSVGRAYLLKHTIDTVDQLTHAITSVAEGRMIVDPTVMEELIKSGDSTSGMLRELSPKALEVLHWVSRGYRNETIAGVLSRDVKTIERHINNIYCTLLNSEDNERHPRVRAALMYLKATGVLSTEQVMED